MKWATQFTSFSESQAYFTRDNGKMVYNTASALQEEAMEHMWTVDLS
jgi:hypothetical protein